VPGGFSGVPGNQSSKTRSDGGRKAAARTSSARKNKVSPECHRQALLYDKRRAFTTQWNSTGNVQRSNRDRNYMPTPG
jgi:hypothetical protein